MRRKIKKAAIEGGMNCLYWVLTYCQTFYPLRCLLLRPR